MKTNITISVDREIAEELRKELNYSDVVNEQLKGYFAVKDCENRGLLKQNLAKIKQILKENRKKRRNIEKQIAKIDAKVRLSKLDTHEKEILMKKIRKRRATRDTEYRKFTFYESIEAEAVRTLKGGNKLK